MLNFRSSTSIRSWCPLLALIRSQSTKSSKEITSSDVINPLTLTEDNVSHMYCVSIDDMKNMFPNSLPRHFATEVNALKESCWLLRKQSYDIMQELKNYDETKPHLFRYLLYGGDGRGKTMCLHQILHYCIKTNWLVIFIPGVFSWTHSSYELRPSTRVPGTYDQPEAACTWLRIFRTHNSNFITELRLSRDWEWSKKDHSCAGEEVNKVIDKGLMKPVLATEIVSGLMEEIVLASNRFKMMLAVDEYNGCFSPTTLKNTQKEWVMAHQLNLVRSILHHVPQFPGAVLLSLSRSRMLRCSTTGWLPNDLLMGGAVPPDIRAESQAILESCCSVEIPQYSRQEMENCLSYYSERKWVNKELNNAVMNELWHLTEGNPYTLHTMCASL